MRANLILSLAPLALLAACGDGKGTTISIDAKGESGEQVAAKADGDTGRVSVDTPVFKANIKLPKVMLDADNVDIGGVPLYPGSTVQSVNITADEQGGADKGLVRIRFAAPADPAAVREWFAGKMRGAGFTLAAAGNGLAGKTKDGEPFRMELTGAAGKTEGVLSLSES